jgi:transglutaminase-like putative cysteine protease
MLLGGALLFWGWQTGFLFLALPLAVLVEAARALTWRLELSATDFHRLTDLCTLLIVVSGIYLFSTTGTSRAAADGPRAMTLLFQWMPLLLFPLIASQLYSTAAKVPLTAFFWALRRQAARSPETRPGVVDLGYLYFAICILAASAANRRTLEFYAGLCVLAGWALWPWRSRRFSPLWWVPMLGIAAVAGYGGHVALHRFQQAVEQTVFDYIFSMVRGDADPFRVTTAIGHLGRLKLSDRTILRVEPRDGLHLPFLLREVSYDVYNSPAWLASSAGFSAVQPEADGETWKFSTGHSAAERVTVSAYLNRGRGVLSLPGGAFEIDRLAVVGVNRNRLGAVKVEEGLGLVTYTALFAPDGPLDGPPTDADLHVPPREAEIVSRVAADLHLAGSPATEKIETIAAYFRRSFRYSTWKGERPRKESALEEFLLNSRAGHCEYFATATTLLLRAAGVPARYAVGFSVQEWSRLEQRYIVRARHAHSWTLAYVNGAWRDVDTTPPVWADADQSESSILEPVHDLWSFAGFLFSRWRWSEEDNGIGRYAAWLLIPLVLLLVWRLYSRRRVGRGATAPPPAPTFVRPGQDSEFYLIEQRLQVAGLGRHGTEPASQWIERIHATDLTPILALHHRYRFDPTGLDPQNVPRYARAEAWLRDHEATEASGPAAEGRVSGRGRRDPFPPRDSGRRAPGWSPAAAGQRTGAAWSRDPAR